MKECPVKEICTDTVPFNYYADTNQRLIGVGIGNSTGDFGQFPAFILKIYKGRST